MSNRIDPIDLGVALNEIRGEFKKLAQNDKHQKETDLIVKKLVNQQESINHAFQNFINKHSDTDNAIKRIHDRLDDIVQDHTEVRVSHRELITLFNANDSIIARIEKEHSELKEESKIQFKDLDKRVNQLESGQDKNSTTVEGIHKFFWIGITALTAAAASYFFAKFQTQQAPPQPQTTPAAIIQRVDNPDRKILTINA